jgi:hypothetical protein
MHHPEDVMSAARSPVIPLYRAWLKREGVEIPSRSDIVYEHKPHGNLIGALPSGTWPQAGACGTLERKDGGDPFERAIFSSPSGRTYVVEREGK